jgi:hypothetical protein
MMDDELEAKKEPRGLRGGIYTEDSGLPPPQNPDGGILKPKKAIKKANGGYVRAADGIAKRGKTRGKMC